MNAPACIRDGDLLTVQEVDRLGRNLLEGLIVLNDNQSKDPVASDLWAWPRSTSVGSDAVWLDHTAEKFVLRGEKVLSITDKALLVSGKSDYLQGSTL
ncbi:hypothetical protein MBA17_26925 [Streptosporangium sp. KLBMP 9127]|nr:hypothetical protein [Streptosporangium sp. KLBMP 9127]